MRNFSLFFLGALLSACSGNTESSFSDSIEDGLAPHSDSIDLVQSPTDISEEITTVMNFKAFSAEFTRMMVYDEEELLPNIQTDSVFFWIEFGEDLQGQSLSLTSDENVVFQVEFSYETSVSVANEGPHCDLYDWQHYRSEWISLPESSSGQYKFPELTEEEERQFPTVDLKKLRKAVENECGAEWGELVQNCDSPDSYPCWIGLSAYVVRITARNTDTQKVEQKIIRFGVPMGC